VKEIKSNDTALSREVSHRSKINLMDCTIREGRL